MMYHPGGNGLERPDGPHMTVFVLQRKRQARLQRGYSITVTLGFLENVFRAAVGAYRQ